MMFAPRRLLVALAFLAVGFPAASRSQEGGRKVGDRVEVYATDAYQWYSGAIAEIGTGEKAGKYLVKMDKWSSPLWAPAKNIRGDGAGVAAKATLERAQATTTPRLARYLIMSYGAATRNPLHLGYLEMLSGGRYRSLDMGDNVMGTGRYEYDSQTKVVRWISGPFLTNKWGGGFEVTREGKTHNIRFTRGTLAVNSTDSRQ